MQEISLEEVVLEEHFVEVLRGQAVTFFQTARWLLARAPTRWGKALFQKLESEANELESFLDDYGAGNNHTFHDFRELVAAVRWFSNAGLTVAHLTTRIGSYGITEALGRQVLLDGQRDLAAVRGYLSSTCEDLIREGLAEAETLGVLDGDAGEADVRLGPARPRRRLPRNIGAAEPQNEEQKIAEVASKFLATCELLDNLRVRRIDDPESRHAYLVTRCSEAQARVFEATVHNLQSSYDTYIKKTVLETRDERLPQLRGFSSVALHLLEAVTFLVHFVERHEGEGRSASSDERLRRIVDRAEVEDIVLNKLLYWADHTMRRGRALAEDLLPAYTNVREFEVALADDLKLHARPASLIVGIVSRYGTPVELEVAGTVCNAGSILELLVTVGSNPDARLFRFRGDENPLRDIALLFEHGLGERGMEVLPTELGYLREN